MGLAKFIPEYHRPFIFSTDTHKICQLKWTHIFDKFLPVSSIKLRCVTPKSVLPVYCMNKIVQ